MTVVLHHGDCLSILPTLADGSVDAVITDPPYHLQSIVERYGAEGRTAAKHQKDGAFVRAGAGFMGKQWDGGDIAFRPEVWRECLRVLKPGGYLAAFGGSRTFWRMFAPMVEAGFVYQDTIMWLYGSGFPKAKWQLKPAHEPIALCRKPGKDKGLNADAGRIETAPGDKGEWPITARSTSSLAMAGPKRCITTDHTLGRWPANVVLDGSPEVVDGFPDTGPSGIGDRAGGCKFFMGGDKRSEAISGFGDTGSAARFFYQAKADADDRIERKIEEVEVTWISEQGPCRVVLRADTEQLPRRVTVESGSADANEWNTFLSGNGLTALCRRASRCITRTGTSWTTASQTWNALTRSLISASTAVASCAPASGGSPAESAGSNLLSATIIVGETESLPGASRALLGTPLKINVSAKLHGHPTVKPVALIRWLVRMLAPEGALVLDPFAGTGTTGAACIREGRRAVLIERESEYAADIRRRLDRMRGADTPLFAGVA